jgi:hypothetical protein
MENRHSLAGRRFLVMRDRLESELFDQFAQRNIAQSREFDQ